MHICGQCREEFENEAAYLDHVCPETKVQPTHPRSMGANYEAIQQAALKRGGVVAAANQSTAGSNNHSSQDDTVLT